MMHLQRRPPLMMFETLPGFPASHSTQVGPGESGHRYNDKSI
jgi:hypothetical protein